MTTQQLWVFNGLYLVLLVTVAIFTRATARRTVLAISGAYVFLLALGHGMMRLVAGPARQDRLARSPQR